MKNSYDLWLQRFARLFNIREKIGQNQTQEFQLFLLNAGQYNANFTSDELTRLEYFRFPFTVTNRHTYIRSSETWAMEMLRAYYIQDKKHKPENFYPIWVDSRLVWDEINRYCTLLEYDNANLIDIVINQSRWAATEQPDDIWIKIRENSFNTFSDIKLNIENQIKAQLIKLSLSEKNLPEALINIFIAEAQGLEIQAIHSQETYDTLNRLFPQNKKKLTLDGIATSYKDDGWYSKIYGLMKYHKLTEISNFKNANALKEYSQSNNDDFLELITVLRDSIINDLPSLKDYKNNINEWIKDNIDKDFKKITSALLFCSPDTYQFKGNTVHAVTIFGHKNLPPSAKSMIDNLGYRIDPIKIIRIILSAYPGLFFEEDITKKFFNDYIVFKEMQKHDALELQEIRQLFDDALAIMSNTQMPQAKNDAGKIDNLEDEDEDEDEDEEKQEELSLNACEDFDIKKHVKKIVNTAEDYQQSMCYIHRAFIGLYLRDTYLKMREENPIRLLCDIEIKLALKNIIEYSSDDNMAHFIKYIQLITETMILDCSINMQSEEIIRHIKTSNAYFAGFPVQKVMVTPYAMRAFTRVFQALPPATATKKLKVSVTNQSYFEWLQNLDRINKNTCEVYRIRHTNELDYDSDVIFLEPHPNNFVESKQFQHDVIAVIDSLNENLKSPKRITVVLDVTLNSINDDYIKSLLYSAASLIKDGRLNIILIQSLTKFQQLGLDKRSAGLLIAINQPEKWSDFNNKIEDTGKQERADHSTLKYFSSFYIYPELPKLYMQNINDGVNRLYNRIIDKINGFVSSRNFLNITTSTDGGSCYVSLNFNNLFAKIDSNFDFNMYDAEKFAEHFIEYFIVPTCKAMRLPISQRMSIGFPLSSINYANTSLRFTVGLENNDALNDYAEVFACAAYVLNNIDNPHMLFAKYSSIEYVKEFFTQKSRIFCASIKDLDATYEVSFDINGNIIFGRLFFDKTLDNEYFTVNINNGETRVDKVNKILGGGWSTRPLGLEFYADGKKLSDDSKICRELYISLYPNDTIGNKAFIDQLMFTDKALRINCAVHTMLHLRHLIVGPVTTNSYPMYLFMAERYVFSHFNGKDYQLTTEGFRQESFSDNIAFIQQGNITLDLNSLTLTDRNYFFRETALSPTQDNDENVPINFKDKNALHFKPAENDKSKISIFGFASSMLHEPIYKIYFERDYLCNTNSPGVSVYKRYINTRLTSFEIDFWCEKNSQYARFLCLLIAIIMKERHSCSFTAYDYNYSRFLFDLPFDDNTDIQFSEVVNLVANHKESLVSALELESNRVNNRNIEPSNNDRDYIFNYTLGWPSGNTGVNIFTNLNLLKKALSIVNIQLNMGAYYPALLAMFGVTEKRATGPKVSSALEKIAEKYDKEIVMKTAVQFYHWTKNKNRHLNMKGSEIYFEAKKQTAKARNS
ncbi:MAG: hypothetical protein WC748_02105 [Legionellales bacterium]|jgi:hypothetical protein